MKHKSSGRHVKVSGWYIVIQNRHDRTRLKEILNFLGFEKIVLKMKIKISVHVGLFSISMDST